jgi:hypothetical protein
MAKKVLVLGFPFDRRIELAGALNYNEETGKDQVNCKVVFAEDVNAALGQASDAHVVVVNTEMCGDFFPRLFSGKYKGHIVPFASGRSQMSKPVAGPDGKPVFPTNYHGLNMVIMSKLSQPLFKIKQEAVATE